MEKICILRYSTVPYGPEWAAQRNRFKGLQKAKNGFVALLINKYIKIKKLLGNGEVRIGKKKPS